MTGPESVIAQLTGQTPAPWPGTAAERLAQHLDEKARQLDWDPSPVRDADRGAVAADEANRILAISRPLADVLGWDPDDLIGLLSSPSFRRSSVRLTSRASLATSRPGRLTHSTFAWSCLSCGQMPPRSAANSSSRPIAARAGERCTSPG